MKLWKRFAIIFCITLVVVFLVRAFLVESYTVSSSQMETALHKGERVLVDKTAYGIRLPMTILSIPFTFNTFLGIKSYVDFIEFPYKRIYEKAVKRNDIVLFNNPLDQDNPLDKRELILSRCVALPEDTIFVKRDEFFINNKKYIPSPDYLTAFYFSSKYKSKVDSILMRLNIPLREETRVDQDSTRSYLSLNRYELFIVNQKLPDSIRLKPDSVSELSYNLVVPSKGRIVELTEKNVAVYAHIIQQENNSDSIKIEGHIILKNGEPLKSYQFNENYYWFISDNPEESIDSRSLGFISEKYLIGRACFIWYSPGKDSGKGGANRCFSVIK